MSSDVHATIMDYSVHARRDPVSYLLGREIFARVLDGSWQEDFRDQAAKGWSNGNWPDLVRPGLDGDQRGCSNEGYGLVREIATRRRTREVRADSPVMAAWGLTWDDTMRCSSGDIRSGPAADLAFMARAARRTCSSVMSGTEGNCLCGIKTQRRVIITRT